MHRMPALRPAVLALTALVATGCYTYVPTDVSDIQPSQTVRLSVDDAELTRLRAYADARQGTVSGEFVAVGPEAVSMVVRTPLAFQQVEIPRSSIVEASVRRADPTRNLIVSAAIVGAIGAAAYFGFEGRGGEQGGPGPQPEDALIPLFTFGLPLPFGR